MGSPNSKGDSSSSTTSETTSSESTNESSNNIISIYVDERLVKKTEMTSLSNVSEDDNFQNAPRELVEFELYVERNNDEKITETVEEPKIILTSQKVPNGFIINGNIFLHDRNWNCIVKDNCLLCNVNCSDLKDHVSSKCHSENLEANKPIGKYDLSIVRKINSIYHCGVCNEVIETNDLTNHFESDHHQDKSLYATNKASDVIFDSDLHKEHANNNASYHFNVNNIVNSGNYFTETAKNEPYDSNEVQNEIDYYEDESTCDQAEGISYASMARTPKIEHPEFVVMDIGDKRISVKFDCYHMVTMIGANKFYCMACKIQDSIRLKTTHCADAGHLREMQKCPIVYDYRFYFVRKIDDKYYHCGLCNNLQLISDIDDHIEFKHEKASRKPDNCQKPNVDTTVSNQSQRVDSGALKTIVIKEGNMYAFLKYISFSLFGRKIRVQLPYYFVLIKTDVVVPVEYVCVLCNENVSVHEILDHVNMDKHLKQLKECPFVNYLGHNCIRKVKTGFYCAFCNILCDNICTLSYHLHEMKHQYSLGHCLTVGTTTQNSIEITDDSYHPVTNIYDEYISQVLEKRRIDVSPWINLTNLANQNKIIQDLALQQDENSQDVDAQQDEDSQQDEDMQSDSDSREPESELEESFAFDENSFVSVKFKNSLFHIPAVCYHAVVSLDNRRHCFVCDTIVFPDGLASHIDSRQHAENLKKHNFVDKYGKHLIRQSYLLFHCATCNIVITKSLLQTHLSSELHSQLKLSINESQSHDSNLDSLELKTQKEVVYLKGKERPVKVIFKAKIKAPQPESYDKNAEEYEAKLKKLVFVRDDCIMKLDWQQWHSIVQSGDSRKCLMCQTTVIDELTHVMTRQHVENLTNGGFVEAHGVNLIRRIDSSNLNCAVCNTQLPDMDLMLREHISGKKHSKNLIDLKQNRLDTYDDCCKNPYFFNSCK